VVAADPRDAAVGERDLEGDDVVGRRAVDRCVGTGRVVADHPAEGGPRRGRDVGPEPQPVRREAGVQLVEDDAGADP
jgi:hypothetical protein